VTGIAATAGNGDPTKSKRLAARLAALTRDTGWARQTCGKALRVLEGERLLTFYPGLGYYATPGNSRER
jgi:hypothetical protein